MSIFMDMFLSSSLLAEIHGQNRAPSIVPGSSNLDVHVSAEKRKEDRYMYGVVSKVVPKQGSVLTAASIASRR
jgi:hypothetical protein